MERNLENIKKYQESYTTYSYKKPDSKELQYKLSYFRYYPHFNWIIAAGVYIDDIENELKIKKSELKEEIKKQIFQNVVLFLLFLTIAIFISAVISNEIYKILKKYKQKVVENEKELKVLNKSLEEMISNIAHQWRQPLGELSSILMFIKLKFDTKLLDEKIMDKKIEDASQVLEYMSHTIDDFRGFFLPTKEKEKFYLYELIENVTSISSSMFRNQNIEIICNIDKNIVLDTYLNEYQQVVLNILKNATDALVENKIKKPYIRIEASIDKESVVLTISDNAGGILIEPINKIFEAYFTTKEQNKGTGIGLYMSKMIVEKSMKGELLVHNIDKEARFTILLPK